jgi:hypothetical protein
MSAHILLLRKEVSLLQWRRVVVRGIMTMADSDSVNEGYHEVEDSQSVVD